MLVAVALLLTAGLTAAPRDLQGFGGPSTDVPAPVVLSGARTVTTHNASGQVQRHTAIPSGSVFATYAASGVATCTFVADHEDTLLSNGDRVPKGTVVTSHYVFIEAPPSNPLPVGAAGLDITFGVPTLGPVGAGSRRFGVWCDTSRYFVAFKATIDVPILDPFLDPRPRIDHLLNIVQLVRPAVFTNPVVDTYGGLITRYPTWLAIDPGAWKVQQSPAENYRGTTILLLAAPDELEFIVDFSPNPAKPSPAYRGVIGCVPDVEPTEGGGALPAFPVLADQSAPGPNGPCTWTPPGPGSVTITARITYAITFWADGYTEAQDPYTWTSEPTTYLTGELTAVNTKP